MPKAIIPHRGERQKTLQTRQEMVTKMANYFVKHGFVNATLDEIADDLGCSCSTLAQIYFPARPNMSSKEHLLLYVLRWVNQIVEAKLSSFQEIKPKEKVSERQWGLKIIDEMEKFYISFPASALPFFITIEYYGQSSVIDKEIHAYYRLYENPLHCFFNHVLDNERANNYTLMTLAMIHGALIKWRYPKQTEVLKIIFDRLRDDWEQGT